MKKLLQSLMVLLVTLTVRAQSSANEIPYLSKSLVNEAIQSVEAKTSGGSIEVYGGNAEKARIEVYVRQNGHHMDISKEEIQGKLNAEYDLTVSATDHHLTAIAKPKEQNINWKRSLSISFKIFLPENVSTTLATSGGSISLSDLSGTQDFKTSGGSLSIKKVSGKMTGKTSGGSISVSDSKDDIELRTSGGSIEADNCMGKIELHTSGGSLDLHGLSGDINATTSGGSVNGKTISGELKTHTSGGNVSLHGLSCSLEASTSGGNINAEITQAGKYISLNNSGGNIDLEIPKNTGYDLKLYAEKIITESLANFNGSTKEKKIEGTLNGGGIPITVDAGGGKINLSFR
jgi:hypothetical protein